MTCRQFPNLTFAPRKTCHLSGSNLSLHRYHATASVSYHMFPVIARDFSTFFADFSLENRGLFLTFLCRMTEPGNGAEKEMFSCFIKGLVTENISFSAGGTKSEMDRPGDDGEAFAPHSKSTKYPNTKEQMIAIPPQILARMK